MASARWCCAGRRAGDPSGSWTSAPWPRLNLTPAEVKLLWPRTPATARRHGGSKWPGRIAGESWIWNSNRLQALQDLVVAWRGGGANSPGRRGAGDRRRKAILRSLTFNGKTAALVGIVRVANSNTVAPSQAVIERVDGQIRPALPPGIELTWRPTTPALWWR